MCLDSIFKDFCRLPDGAVLKQLRAPYEIVLLTRIQADRLLIFLNRSERIVQLLIEFAGGAMQFRVVFALQQILDMHTGLAEIARFFVSQCQVAFIAIIRG